MAGPAGDANDALIRHGFSSVRPVLFQQDCLAYLCAFASGLAKKFGIDIGEPPQNPFEDWVTEMADAYFTDPDEVQMSAEERFMSMMGGIGEVNMGGP